MLDTVTGYCDLCSMAVKDKNEARELMVSGKVFTFCCKSCESSFISKDTPEEPSTFLTHQIEEATPLLSWLQEAVRQGASDLFMSVGEQPTLKIYGVFKKLSDEVLDHQHVEEFIKSILPQNKLTEFSDGKDVDLGLAIKGVSRFRINIFKHHKGLSIAVRPLPDKIPSFSELGLPEVFHDLTGLKHGLVLITGPAGSGKTTTLASFINAINQNEERHIITIEDPIEYLIENKRSLIHQREVGWHTTSFADGLRSALRESPDIIVVGELRDLESISLCLRAAETGHLVLATLHSGTAVQALTRIIDVFDSVRQEQVMVQLAQSLQCVCSQNLIKRIDKPGMILATEILIGTVAISNIIRQNRVHEIRGYMETGQAEKMHTFKQSMAPLIEAGIIDKEQVSDVKEMLDTKV
jgi:twitching motility protein PilT